jgi:hypothetical protein
MNKIRVGIIEFVKDHLSLESNDILTQTIVKINSSNSFEEIFKIPINDHLFSFDDSIKWIFFLYVTINYINDNKIESFNLNFSLIDAYYYISNVYSFKRDCLLEYYSDS